jgi:hypothetical protein
MSVPAGQLEVERVEDVAVVRLLGEHDLQARRRFVPRC